MPDIFDTRSYVCRECGATGCKLWRMLGDHVSPKLLCITCTRGKCGRRDDAELDDALSDPAQHRIGDFVPAVPCCGDNRPIQYYFLGSIPGHDYSVWETLPTRPGPVAPLEHPA